jgi:hypothetical protein
MLDIVHCEIYNISVLSFPAFAVGTGIMLQVGWPRRRGSILGRGKTILHNVMTGCDAHITSYTMLTGAVSPEVKGQGA